MLIADGLSVYHETHLCVVTQRVEETVPIVRDTAGAIYNGLTQTGARIDHGELEDLVSIDIDVSGGILLDHSSGSFHVNSSRAGGNCQRNVHGHRYGTANFHFLVRHGETGSFCRQPIAVLRNVVEAEHARLVGHCRLIVAGYRIAQSDFRSAHNRIRLICDGAG